MSTQSLVLCVIIGVTGTTFAQKDTVEVQGYLETGQEGTLNAAVEAVRDTSSLSQTVFLLHSDERYVQTGSIVVGPDEVLDIVAPEPGPTQDTAPPQILWTNQDVGREYFIQNAGKLILKNLWVYYADIDGNQLSSSIGITDNPDSTESERATFDGVIFDYGPIAAESGGSVNVKADHFVGTFTNCYFRNNTDSHFRYYGRAVSFPYQSRGWHVDSLLFENTTFANIGYVYMQEGGEYGDNVHFNHCTFLNVVMYALESPWWYKMSVTNSVFVNPFMYGYMPAWFCEEGEDFLAGECDSPNGGIFTVVSVDSFEFEVDFKDLDRQILLSHSSYVYKDWLIDWMEYNPGSVNMMRDGREDEIPLPQPYVSRETLAFMDSTDADGEKVFKTMEVDESSMHIGSRPRFRVPPTNMESLRQFLYCKWFSGCDSHWAYEPQVSRNHRWPLPEDLSYTNDTLLTAAMGGFPLGDLNWFPEAHADWRAQRNLENERITRWLQTGTDPGPITELRSVGNTIPAGYHLAQNYPNPFNPVTWITYTTPERGHVTLTVYNLLGEEVAMLVQGIRDPGNHKVTFNAKELPSGIYLYRLKARDHVLTRKLIVTR